MRTLVLSFCLMYSVFVSAKELNPEKKCRKLYFYLYGLPAYTDSEIPGSCRYEEAAKMVFGYITKAGCVMRPLKYKRLEAHNNRIEKKMVKRHGPDWHAQYEEAMKKCYK